MRDVESDLWDRRLARTCPGCGCKAVGDDGRCTRCGATKRKPVKLTSCAACRRVSCWRGEFMCERARAANVVELPIDDLIALGLEHPDSLRRWAEEVRR
jgi:hypothetical protein